MFFKRYKVTKKERNLLARAKKAQEEPVKDLSGNASVLLVEDEEGVALFAKNALVDRGYRVTSFSSAKDALNFVQSEGFKFDVVVTDVVMPEMNGTTFIKEIKKTTSDVKVIFMSGYAEDAFTEEYGSDRDFEFLQKPFSLKELVTRVKEVLEGEYK